ncbi:AGE2 [Candida pseudojiufengensis]|uniref:AGE2 n=1 Tax=Candida pseudojiufengensis TaxID=497109 RepID=UPI002224ABAA|nr:AGE2 [Candida pseudojiufengensis]KAI5965332.1 AGE2 [Candida pseudojiufengensis]
MSHRSSALPSSKKTHSERHKQILKQLLKEEPNRSCADCKLNKNPRWASWNLGCFICIRCSGIHRSMGTHISKVKSVDLDAWTDDQIDNMLKWGNEKSNEHWESKLPDDYTPDQSKIENFIRTKYDLKKWCSSHTIPNPNDIKINTSSKKTPTNSNTQPKQATSSKSASVPSSNNLLDDEFGLFTSTTTNPTSNKSQINSTSSHRSSLPNRSTPQPQAPQQIQSAQSTGGSISSNTRPDLKKSILSLYASPSSSSSFIQQQNKSNSPHINSLSDSLNGLNFQQSNSTSNLYSSKPISQPQYSNSTGSLGVAINNQKNWTNEWNDSSTSSVNTKSSVNVTLDDDLFKNVWN